MSAAHTEPTRMRAKNATPTDGGHTPPRARLAPFLAMDAIFIPKGNVFEPTELARGPWDPDAQHGGAPAALIAHELERVGGDWPFARIALHLMKPMPLKPLTLKTELVRDGRRARRFRVDVSTGDDHLCLAYALQLRPGDEPVPEVPLSGTIDPPESGTELPNFTGYRMFGGDGIEIRLTKGHFHERGPATAWFRLRVPIVEGEPTSQLQRAMAAADFGNGISAAVSWEDFTFVNPELTVYFLREPEGDWVGNDAVTAIDPGGIGLSDATLHDRRGPFARAIQSLYVSPRR